MNKIIYVLICLVYTSILNSQTIQRGLVREFNSGKKPVSGVALHFLGATTTESDVEGKFVLTFDSNKKSYGDPISFVEAIKSGYEVVNVTQLHSLRLSSNDTLATDLILAKHGVIQAAKAQYAGASLEALSHGFEREKAELLKQVNEAEIKEDDYIEKMRLLSEKYEKQQARLDDLAHTFARVNFDDVSDEYKEALIFYKQGKLDEAIAKLESQNLTKQTQDILYETKRIEGAENRLESEKRRLLTKKRQHIDMLITLADLYEMDFKPLRMDEILNELFLIDSTDIKILWKVANYYRGSLEFEKAIPLYTKIFKHPLVQDWQIELLVDFPLRRNYPIPHVEDVEDFKNRYSQIFDKDLEGAFANLPIESMGWNGFMLGDGIVWLDEYDGRIKAINYNSNYEKKQIDLIIQEEKENIHSSLKNFKTPICQFKTKSLQIRIDVMPDDNYRYASWKIDDKESSIPYVICNNGNEVYYHKGYQTIVFNCGPYKYTIDRTESDYNDSWIYIIKVEKNSEIILYEFSEEARW